MPTSSEMRESREFKRYAPALREREREHDENQHAYSACCVVRECRRGTRQSIAASQGGIHDSRALLPNARVGRQWQYQGGYVAEHPSALLVLRVTRLTRTPFMSCRVVADPALFVRLQTSPALPLLIKTLDQFQDPPADELRIEENQQAWNICTILRAMAANRSSFARSIIDLVCRAAHAPRCT